MTHLDEGQLHAYLDGEGTERDGWGRSEIETHLAECSACRARLEDQRRLRDRARAILGTAGPMAVSPPPFDAVLQRAARKRERKLRIPPMTTLAWAASLALAVGVGWYARSLVLEGGGAAAAGVATGATPPQVRADAIQAAPPAARQLAQGTPAREAPARPPQEGIGAVASTATAAVQDRPVANLTAAEAKAPPDTEAPPLRVTEAPVPSPAPAIALRRVQPAVAAPDLAERGWITVPPAEAERRLGGPLATIPGLPSLGTSVFGTGPSAVARTIQVLGPGLTIELVQQRATTAAPERAARERAAAPAAMPQAERAIGDEPGRALTVPWEGFSVTGRALVPDDSLRRLLSRLSRP
ncbi:MAG: zf-HC2 domain-containing protein [Gemmatimonadetes bacterium]|nr:zf-HC2 domain-containing protein [Gemmatimonadota bacterium]MBI2537774.1 zf-HC2 domain-containing protein [Gemmatimonadota bacterium]